MVSILLYDGMQNGKYSKTHHFLNSLVLGHLMKELSPNMASDLPG